MLQVIVRPDPHHFVSYYENQAGEGLPSFYGVPAKIISICITSGKKGVLVCKSNLGTSAKNIARDVLTHAVNKKP